MDFTPRILHQEKYFFLSTRELLTESHLFPKDKLQSIGEDTRKSSVTTQAKTRTLRVIARKMSKLVLNWHHHALYRKIV